MFKRMIKAFHEGSLFYSLYLFRTAWGFALLVTLLAVLLVLTLIGVSK